MITLKKTKSSDWSSIRKSVLEVEKRSFEKKARFDEDDFDTFLNKKAINMVAKEGKRIVGYLMSCSLGESYWYRKKKVPKDIILLESIALLPEYRGKGIGRKMFLKFMSSAKNKGYNEAVLDATGSRMKKLAESYGFEKVRRRKRWIGDRSSWLMRKSI